MKALTVTLLLIIYVESNPVERLAVDLDSCSVGTITCGNRIVGTGFVLEQPNFVITCAHVVDGCKDCRFYPAGDRMRFYTFKSVKVDTVSDIATCQTHVNVCVKPLKRARFDDISILDSLYYIGYNDRISSQNEARLSFHKSIVSQKGSRYSVNRLIKFLDFAGEGVNGYSGGPVLNDKYEVVGIFSQAYYTLPLEDNGVKVLVNTAGSIDEVQLIDNE